MTLPAVLDAKLALLNVPPTLRVELLVPSAWLLLKNCARLTLVKLSPAMLPLTVARADDLEAAIGEWLAQPGPALLNVKVENMTLVMPPAIEFGPAYGMVLYSARAVLGGQTHDLIEMVRENI